MKITLLLMLAAIAASNVHGQQLRVLPFGGISAGTIGATRMLPRDTHPQTFYEAGADVEIRFKNHLTLTTGIGWIHMGYKQGPYVLEDNFDPLTGNTINVLYEITRCTSALRVPLKIGYRHSVGRHFNLGASAGPSLNYLLNVTSMNTRSTQEHDETSDYKRLNVGLIADLSASYNFTRHLGVMLSPVYSYNPFRMGHSDYEHLHTFGARLAAVIRL